MTYRINGKLVTKEEWDLSPKKGITSGNSFFISEDYKEYTCPITGKLIAGKTQHRDNLARHNCRILEKGEREWAEKTRQDNINKSADKTAEETVYRTIRNMSDSFWKGFN